MSCRRRPLNSSRQAIHCRVAQRRALSVWSGRWKQPPRLPIIRPRCGVAMISPAGVTRFWSGIVRSAKLGATHARRTTMSEAAVHVKMEDRPGGARIARVTVDNTAKLNCLSTTTIVALAETFKRLGEDAQVRAVVFTGAGEQSLHRRRRPQRAGRLLHRQRAAVHHAAAHGLQGDPRLPGAGDRPHQRLLPRRGAGAGGLLRHARGGRGRAARHARGAHGHPVGDRGGPAAGPDRLGPHARDAADGRALLGARGARDGPGAEGGAARRSWMPPSSPGSTASAAPRRRRCARRRR